MQMKSVRRLCAAMLVFAVAVRLVTAAENMAAAANTMQEDRKDAVYTLHIIPPLPPLPPAAEEKLTFTAADAQGISIGGSCRYAVDKQALLQRPSGLDFSAEGPKVLVVHTHSSEAYTPEEGLEYAPSDFLRTEDAERSVIRVGTEICEVLRQNGIEALHDETINDYPSYAGSYERMRGTIAGYLEQYPSIQMVLDVHRDAASFPDGTQVAFRTELNGERAAQIMFVVGTDAGGLWHPNWEENLANVLKLQAILNKTAPTLCREVDLRTERFNADLSAGAMLVEFGSTGNTLSEALCAARVFAQGLTEAIFRGY
jgi:stage II sporulation protein P